MRKRPHSPLFFLPLIPLLACKVVGGAPPTHTPQEHRVDATKNDLGAYQQYLASIGSAGAQDAKEDAYLALGGWRFFLRSVTPGDKRDPAAISPAGDVVSERAKGRWNAFLGQSGTTPAELARRVVWLLGNSGVAEADVISEKQARKLITPPAVQRSGDNVVLTFWQISPPDMNSPYRVTVTAPAQGDVSIEYKHWKEVPKKSR